jgi:hypothetical protein
VVRLALAAALLAGCAARGAAARSPGGEAGGDAHITLYRDGAVVAETVAIAVAAGTGYVAVPRPLGVELEELTIEAASPGVRVAAWGAASPGELAVEVAATRAGAARLTLRYLSDRLTWQASYTLIDDRGRGRLHGALALRNDTGRRFQRARIAVLDRGLPVASPTAAAFAQRAVVVPGLHPVRPGVQRVELGGGALALRPTLVYDPVGTRFDSATLRPQMDPAYAVERVDQALGAAVDESVLIELSRVSAGPLPAGPVRVFTVGDGGALAWRGEGRLLPPTDDAERYTTVSVGRSPDVTGARRRTDFAIDRDANRMVEEVTVTLRNDGDAAADVLVREHLYRGQCWTVAYHSTGHRVAKEGVQQIGLGVTVPAGGAATVMYRVVYEWGPKGCPL